MPGIMYPTTTSNITSTPTTPVITLSCPLGDLASTHTNTQQSQPHLQLHWRQSSVEKLGQVSTRKTLLKRPAWTARCQGTYIAHLDNSHFRLLSTIQSLNIFFPSSSSISTCLKNSPIFEVHRNFSFKFFASVCSRVGFYFFFVAAAFFHERFRLK